MKKFRNWLKEQWEDRQVNTFGAVYQAICICLFGVILLMSLVIFDASETKTSKSSCCCCCYERR